MELMAFFWFCFPLMSRSILSFPFDIFSFVGINCVGFMQSREKITSVMVTPQNKRLFLKAQLNNGHRFGFEGRVHGR